LLSGDDLFRDEDRNGADARPDAACVRLDDRKLDFLGARRKLASSETYLRATPGSQRHFSLVKVLLCDSLRRDKAVNWGMPGFGLVPPLFLANVG
jgi:hypothetical protein